MRFPLRWRILVFTALPLMVLTAATMWTVNRALTGQARDAIHDGLLRSALVFENMMAERGSQLAIGARVIAADPRFASLFSIPAGSGSPHYRATVRRVAGDFNDITRAGLFDVLDRHGTLLASAGRAASEAAARAPFVEAARRGQPTSGILVQRGTHYQVAVTPVRLGRQVVGVLVLGAAIGEPLARELHTLTRSEVTFVSSGRITGSSFAYSRDRAAVLAALPLGGATAAAPGAGEEPLRTWGGLVEVPGATTTWLTLVRRIPQSAPGADQLYVMQRSVEAETAYLREIQERLLRLGLLAALAALLAGVLVADRITRPVLRLVRGAEAMERGDYDYPLGRAGRDEVGYLAQRFGDMRQHERAYVARLQEVARVKSDFINVASHELCTPVTVIKSYHELLADVRLGPLTPGQQEALAGIGQSIERLERIAEETSRMAQFEGDRPALGRSEVRVADVVGQAVARAIAGARGRAVHVTCGVDPDAGTLAADAPLLAQAVTQLVTNGIRFTPDGGHVRVAARREPGAMVIDVEDDGVGIHEEGQRRLLDRPLAGHDWRNHHSSDTLAFNSAGLGLGLPLARAIVEAHGGTLGLRSVPGQGSTFTVRLPLAEPDSPAAAA